MCVGGWVNLCSLLIQGIALLSLLLPQEMRLLLVCYVMGMLRMYVYAISVNEGEDIIQRRLGETIVEEDRTQYEQLLAQSALIRKEIARLSRLLPEENASERIKQLNTDLQETIRSTIAISQQSTNTASRKIAAERAIERAKKRDAIRRLEVEKKKREEEDFNYIQNLRKMELVDNTVEELQSRAVIHGLNEFGTVSLSFFEYLPLFFFLFSPTSDFEVYLPFLWFSCIVQE